MDWGPIYAAIGAMILAVIVGASGVLVTWLRLQKALLAKQLDALEADATATKLKDLVLSAEQLYPGAERGGEKLSYVEQQAAARGMAVTADQIESLVYQKTTKEADAQ